MPLTDTHIRSLKPDVKPRKYFDGGGLFLYVPTSGSKLWKWVTVLYVIPKIIQ